MRVLLIDRAGDGLLDLGMRAWNLGHQVKMFLRDFDHAKRPIGKGLIDLVADWRPWIRWADLVLLGSNDLYMQELERWRREGVPIVGGTPESCLWETDRAYGMKVLKHAGIEVPPYASFTDYDKAIAYVKARKEGFASKPSGKCDDKSLSYVAEDAAELVYMLERWKRQGKREGLEFILQDKVSGIETGVGAWFGPNGFAPGWEENFEFKKLMPGDIGPNTGELGSVLHLTNRSKLADKVLKPLEEQLFRIGYIGNVDVNCIVDSDGTPWPLEFTMRFGYPAINIELELFDGDPVEFLFCLATGEKIPGGMRRHECAVGVCLVLPPFPHAHSLSAEVVGVPLWGYEKVAAHIHPAEMMMTEAPHQESDRIEVRPCFGAAGDYVLVATGSDTTVGEARDKAYRVLGKLRMPRSPFWRDDIGERLQRQLPKLHDLGFAAGLDYR